MLIDQLIPAPDVPGAGLANNYITTPLATNNRNVYDTRGDHNFVDSALRSRARFESAGEVYATETPAGTLAVAVHVGTCDRMTEARDALNAWREANNGAFAGKSWEIYGGKSDDPSKLGTHGRVFLPTRRAPTK